MTLPSVLSICNTHRSFQEGRSETLVKVGKENKQQQENEFCFLFVARESSNGMKNRGKRSRAATHTRRATIYESYGNVGQ